MIYLKKFYYLPTFLYQNDLFQCIIVTILRLLTFKMPKVSKVKSYGLNQVKTIIPIIYYKSHYFPISHYLLQFPLFTTIPIIYYKSHYFPISHYLLQFPLFTTSPIIYYKSHYFPISHYLLQFPLFTTIPIIFLFPIIYYNSHYLLQVPLFFRNFRHFA